MLSPSRATWDTISLDPAPGHVKRMATGMEHSQPVNVCRFGFSRELEHLHTMSFNNNLFIRSYCSRKAKLHEDPAKYMQNGKLLKYIEVMNRYRRLVIAIILIMPCPVARV